MAYVRVWSFTPHPDRLAEFEDAYGPNGAWARLFHRAPGFLGTTLLRGEEDYVTLDRWASREAWDRFRGQFGKEYEALDRQCEDLTMAEEEIGEYEEVG